MAKAREKSPAKKDGSAAVRKKKLPSHVPGKPMFIFWLLSPVLNLIRSSAGHSIVDKTRILQRST
jgi:hypothetical protein